MKKNQNKREFKFRVWDKTTKKFLEVDKDNPFRYIDTSTNALYNLSEIIQYDRFIIQQWTGLKDINNKDIYEGDIFKSKRSKWDVVEFVDGRFRANLKGARLYDLYELFEENGAPEVIGNVFENKDLLK